MLKVFKKDREVFSNTCPMCGRAQDAPDGCTKCGFGYDEDWERQHLSLSPEQYRLLSSQRKTTFRAYKDGTYKRSIELRVRQALSFAEFNVEDSEAKGIPVGDVVHQWSIQQQKLLKLLSRYVRKEDLRVEVQAGLLHSHSIW